MLITTKKLGATNTKPARVIAHSDTQKYAIEWDHSLNTWDNHWAAARRLCQAHGIKQVAFTDSKDRSGYVFMPLNVNFVQDVGEDSV